MTHGVTVTIARPPAIQIHDNGNANDTRLCADVDVGWIHGTVSCWLCTWSWYMVLVHVWVWNSHCVIYDALSQLYTRPLINYNDNDIQYSALHRCWYWLNTWNGVVLDKREQEVRWYWCLLEFECVICLVHDAFCLPPSPFIAHAPFVFIIWYMKWCHVGFGRTESTLTLVYNNNNNIDLDLD